MNTQPSRKTTGKPRFQHHAILAAAVLQVFTIYAATTTAGPIDPLAFAPLQPAEFWMLAHPGTYVNDDGVTKRYDAVYHVPENPVGLVYVFHPGGGSAQRYTDNIEVIDILNHLTKAGFAFIATDSALRNDNHDTIAPELIGLKETARWDKFPTTKDHTNRDFGRLLQMRERLIDANADIGLTAQTPLFAFGMSSGANFSYTFAHMAEQRPGVPDLSAIGVYNGRFSPITHPVISDGVLIDTPTFIVTGENDDPDMRLPSNVNLYKRLKEAGIPTEFHLNREHPLNPDRFDRIPAVAKVTGLSDDLFDLFVNGDPTRGLPGFLLPDGERRFADIDNANKVINTYTDSLNHLLAANIPLDLVGDTRFDIENQLKVNWAMHVTDANWAHQHTRFFLSQLTDSAGLVAPVPEPATLAMLSIGMVLLRPQRKPRIRRPQPVA